MNATLTERGPYKGLMPYDEEDAPFFFGRDTDRKIITANAYAARLTVLYGASGVGKSSVLQAGVAYHLHQRPDRPVVIFNRWHGQPASALTQAIAAELSRTSGEPVADGNLPLSQFLKQKASDLPGPLLIILDQFEEYFLYQPRAQASDTFFSEFVCAVNQPHSPVNFLISLREDALAKLDCFENDIPDLFESYLRVDHLNRAAARQAITEPLAEYNRRCAPNQRVEIEESLVEKIIEEVRMGKVFVGEIGRGRIRGVEQEDRTQDVEIETPYLQLVLTRLWDAERRQGSRVLRKSTLVSLGGAETIVRTHLDNVMGRLRPAEQDVGASIFNFLVTPSGTKIAHGADDLAFYAEMPVDRVEDLAHRLASQELRVLKTVPGVTQDGSPRYEIYHDVLAPAVLDWRTRYLRRTAFSSSRMLLIAAAVVVGATVIQAVVPLPAVLLVLARMAALLVAGIVVTMQVYNVCYRYVRSSEGGMTVVARGRLNLGIPLGALLIALWYSATEWRDCTGPNDTVACLGTALTSIASDEYIFLVFFALFLTLFFGFAAFVGVLWTGRLTFRLFKRFDAGFYGMFLLICGVIVLLTLLQTFGVIPEWIGLSHRAS